MKPMEPEDAWLYAASWGSAMTVNDPGACMYGFNEHCRPMSEKHREDVIRHCEDVCIPMVKEHPEWYDKDELIQMRKFLEYIRSAPLTTD